MIDLRRIRLTAVLLPAALLLHEGAYALSPGIEAGSHGYLAVLLPLGVVLAGSLALADLIGSILRPLEAQGPSRPALSPLLFASALIAIFAGQELVEALISGAGPIGLLTTIAAAPLLLPLALALGLVAAALTELLGWAGLRLARLVRGRRPARHPSRAAERRHWGPLPFPIPPLAFGIASRPPPRPSAA